VIRASYSLPRPLPIELHGRGTQVERQAISIIKAAQLVGVSRRTIYNWLASGKLEYVRTAGGSVRIFVDSLWREPMPAHQRPTPDTITSVIPGTLS
jgi:excisionase family DNA binding protein